MEALPEREPPYLSKVHLNITYLQCQCETWTWAY